MLASPISETKQEITRKQLDSVNLN